MAERYEIIGKLGSGGVGAVYEALDTFLDRKVAIKRLLPADESESPELSQGSLQKETAALSALQHPNIVTIFDVGEDEDGQFVVMEMIDGENVEEATERETFELDTFVEFAGQTLDALAAAQSLNLLHRDIKPRNLMVRQGAGGKPQAKILDFGLAKFAPKPALQTMDQNKAVLGSVFYMAPEQFERRPLDRRTDVYSLGSVFFYALSGHDPFDGATAVDVMNAHLEHRVHHVREFRKDLPEELGDWLMWLMNREMENRPESAEQALNVLTNLKKSGFHRANAAPFAASVAQTSPKMAVSVASDVPGKRRLLRSVATSSVMERDATTGLVPDVKNGKLTRPPAAPRKVKRATGRLAATGTAPKSTQTGPLVPSTSTRGIGGDTAQTPAHGTRVPAGFAAATATGKMGNGGYRALVWIGATVAGFAIFVVLGILIAGFGGRKGKDQDGLSLTNTGAEAAGAHGDFTEWGAPSGGEKEPEKWVPQPGGDGGDDLFAKGNWYGGEIPKPGGAATISKGTARTIHRVNGPIQLTVEGRLEVERYYDVISFGGSEGTLKIEPGGELVVGKKNKGKLVIGRLSSGSVDVWGKLNVASTLEVGDAVEGSEDGGESALRIEGGTVRATSLVAGKCKWVVDIDKGGEVLIGGDSDFENGNGTLTVAGGGLFRTAMINGLARSVVKVRIDKGGRIQLAGEDAEKVMRGWLNTGMVNSDRRLEITKVDVDGQVYFQLSTANK